MRKAALLVNNEYDQIERPVRKSRGGPKQYSDPTQIGKPKQAANSKMHMTLKDIKPLTEAQRQMMVGFENGEHLLCVGSAGTGKSYLACALALKSLMAGDVSSIKIVRSAVPTRELGFLKGSLEEKIEIYALPYKDIVNDIMGCGTAWETLYKKGMIEFHSTSFVRGLTFRDSIVIFDEFQNATRHECTSLLSRCGENCFFILCGDTRQKDVPAKDSGFDYITKLVSKLPKFFSEVRFTHADIIRSAFCKALIIADEEIL